jgi:hypothetical protein
MSNSGLRDNSAKSITQQMLERGNNAKQSVANDGSLCLLPGLALPCQSSRERSLDPLAIEATTLYRFRKTYKIPRNY